MQVYRLADKYEVPDLKALAVKRFRFAASVYYDNGSDLLLALKLLYENTTSVHADIRSAAVDAWLCRNRISDGEEDSQAFTKSLTEMPQFAADLATRYAKSYSGSYGRFQVHCVCGRPIEDYSYHAFVAKQCQDCGSNTRWRKATVSLCGTLETRPNSVYSPAD